MTWLAGAYGLYKGGFGDSKGRQAVVMTGRIAVVKFGVNLVVNGCFNKRYNLELRVLLLTWVASARL